MELLAPNLTLLLWSLFSAFAMLLALIALFNWLGAKFVSLKLKIAWLCVILFIPVAGPILYFVVGKRSKVSTV